MSGAEVGLISVALILVLIYTGLYIPVALGLVSFLGVWIMRGNVDVPINLLALAAADSISDPTFAVVPLFALMGLLVSLAGLGKDIYEVANYIFRKVRGGLGIATVAANAVFAAITGSSIASASVFTKVSVPEMRHFGYKARFTVGVVAGSSVLGMLIPPSVMLILYAIITEQSVGHMFIAGVIPGIILSIAYAIAIIAMAYVIPDFVGGRAANPDAADRTAWLTFGRAGVMVFPIVILILLVLGGIYTGWFTPTEAGAAGALAALIITLIKRKLTLRGLWKVLVETGHITATILLLLIAASIYSRMLGVAALPTLFGEWIQAQEFGFYSIMALYVVLLVLMGTILDTVSIILIVVPLFLPVLEPYGIHLVWFGIVTVVGAEIGLLTPPLGISCFTIHSTLNDPSISLFDIFSGAFPFAVMMLLVLILIIIFPALSLALI
ncbi:MAG: TRAP transporter large permease [Anaerolineales bacterium]